MAFPLKVHRITVRYQNQEEAYELTLDPAAIQTLIVHWKELRPFGLRNPELVNDDPTGLGLCCVAGVGAIRQVAIVKPISRELALAAPVPCWHDDLCYWHCPNEQTDFVVTEVEFMYANLDGTWRTVLDPAWADQIVFRNYAEADPTYQPPARTHRVIPARELRAGEYGVLVHEGLAQAASVAGAIGWHDPNCTWYDPE